MTTQFGTLSITHNAGVELVLPAKSNGYDHTQTQELEMTRRFTQQEIPVSDLQYDYFLTNPTNSWKARKKHGLPKSVKSGEYKAVKKAIEKALKKLWLKVSESERLAMHFEDIQQDVGGIGYEFHIL